MLWGHFLAIACTLLAAALVVAANVWSYQRSVGQIFSSLVRDNTAAGGTNPALAPNPDALDAAREGVRWAQNYRTEANVWAIVLLVLGVVLGGYHFWAMRAMRY